MPRPRHLAIFTAAAPLVFAGCSRWGVGGERERGLEQAESHLGAGEEALQQGDKQKALEELARAIEINANLTKAHMDIGDIQRTDGNYAAAEVAYHKVAELEPRNFDAQYYDGLMLHLLDRVAEAVSAYLRALSVRPNDFQANFKLATAYYQLDENAQALEYARRAVALRPDDGQARFQLGAVYGAMNDHRNAVKEYQQAAEHMDLTPSLLLNLAESLGKIERFGEMKNTLEQVIKTEPSAAAWERMGFAHFRLKEYDKALEDFQNSLKVDRDYFPALNGMGICLLNRWILSDRADAKSHDEGVRALRRSLQIKIDQPRIVELVSRYGA